MLGYCQLCMTVNCASQALLQHPQHNATKNALYCLPLNRGTYVPLPPHVSPEAKDLVKRLLTVDPVQRITMPDILRHPWVNSAMGGLGGIAGPTGGTAVLPWPAWNDAQVWGLGAERQEGLLGDCFLIFNWYTSILSYAQAVCSLLHAWCYL